MNMLVYWMRSNGLLTPDISYGLYFLGNTMKLQFSNPISISCSKAVRGNLFFNALVHPGAYPGSKHTIRPNTSFLARNPWDQWYSYKVDPYISTTSQLIYSQPRLPKVLQDVMAAKGALPTPIGDDILEMSTYAATHPITPGYRLFSVFWPVAFFLYHRPKRM